MSPSTAPNESELEYIVETISTIFIEVGEYISNQAGKVGHTSKPDGSPVTDVDVEAEKRIFKALADSHIQLPVFGEESGYNEAAIEPNCILIDPIDGTESFLLNSGTFTCMALIVASGLAAGCVIYNPTSKALFTAIKGKGAFKNGDKLSLLYGEMPEEIYCKTKQASTLRQIIGDKPNMIKTPQGAGYCFCQVAEGLSAGRFVINGKGYVHDYAPGALLVEEAGGVLVYLDEKTDKLTSKRFVAAHPGLSPTLKENFAKLSALPADL